MAKKLFATQPIGIVQYSDLKTQVEDQITPTPFLEGPQGVSLPGARVRFI